MTPYKRKDSYAIIKQEHNTRVFVAHPLSDHIHGHIPPTLKGIKPNFQPARNKNRENTRQRKTITRTRQYLCGSAICLRPRSCRDITIIREEYRVQLSTTIFSLYIKHGNNTTLKNPNYKRRFHNGLNGPKSFSRGRCPPDPQIGLSRSAHGLSLCKSPTKNHAILFGSGRQTGSNKTRLHKDRHTVGSKPILC